MEKTKITIPPETLKDIALSYLPTDPPLVIYKDKGGDISVEEIKKELIAHYEIKE